MNVPPYVPQPIEIEKNVAQEKHLVRVGFIRRVVSLHYVSVAIVVLIALSDLFPLSIETGAWIVLSSLLALSLVRSLTKGRRMEQRISLVFSIPLLAGLGVVGREAEQMGYPVWLLAIGPTCLLIYSLLCGRDLSFMGMFYLCLTFSSVAIAATSIFYRHQTISSGGALLVNALYISYFVYDLAALQTRRRLREEWGAVVDLYRDVLNIFTYAVRVWNHWRKHRIWADIGPQTTKR